MSSSAVIFEERLRVPAAVHELGAFRRWSLSSEFPDSGRIDFLAGDVEIDMSPEDLQTHGVLKAEMAAVLQQSIARADRGQVFIDSTRVTAPSAGLSAEPDLVVVLWDSLESGRVRYVPASGLKMGRFREIEGPPDLVVEIVSDASVGKDTQRLPPLYARAGVPELWLADARGDAVDFRVHALDRDVYRVMSADPEGWVPSQILGRELRLTRERTRMDTWRYDLISR